MSHRRQKTSASSDGVLAAWSSLLAVAGAAAFAAWRALTADGADAGERLATFGASLLWPGAVIFFGIAAVVWMGWKVSLD